MPALIREAGALLLKVRAAFCRMKITEDVRKYAAEQGISDETALKHLDLIPAAETLADEVLHSGLLPANADGDAAHIALATVHRLDILLTWNCRHIANAVIVGRLRRLVEAQGHTLPEIYTPEEFMGE